ncbi:nineteen complex-related protein 2-domain-containing protein [Lipomyces tetrasporus]|uniref:Nineteen complex-related protein 2-domain-containing protein n=1 Tax=Lipomyces tetrasporus TaxID=54092 RepID=A0AAD7QU26_9ASCO|nr:nineteen complex-related protein 2-domain-containing protein [Lipomyces tetrasporus]KAJ8101465.1 nineteen complex-related protein 2-domain-containing protein [Lipomyces tetrasporus]
MTSFGPANRFKKAASGRRARPRHTFDYEEVENGSRISLTSTAQGTEAISGENLGPEPTNELTENADVATDNSPVRSFGKAQKNVTTSLQDIEDDEQDDYHVVTAASLKRKQKSKGKGLSASLLSSKARTKLAPDLPGFPAAASANTTTYSKSYLDELRDSTPTTPAAYTSSHHADEPGDIEMLDDSLYGADTATAGSVAGIPDEALVNHLVERRHKRAEAYRKDDFISLDNKASDEEVVEDMEGVEMYDKPEQERLDRLQREDDVVENEYEMLAEGSDGRIPLSAAQETEQKKQRRRDIEEMIKEHEDEALEVGNEYFYGAGDDSSSDSGWEQAQIQKGALRSKAFSTNPTEADSNGVPKQSGTQESSFMVLQELPDLESVIRRLNITLVSMREQRDSHLKVLEELNTQKQEIDAREKQVKEALSAAPF